MGIKLDKIEFAPNKPRRQAKPKQVIPILQRAKDKFNENLQKSIEQAEGRYIKGDAASQTNPITFEGKKRNKAFAAPFWGVEWTKKDDDGNEIPDVNEDRVWIGLKVGNSGWPILESSNGELVKKLTNIKAKTLVPQLKALGGLMDNMDEATKKSFHELAKEVYMPPADKKKANKDREYRYDTKTDTYIKK